MPEEAPRGGVDAIGAAAEIDLVEIELEDLLLAEFPFQRERQDHLAKLAREGPAVGQEDVARELLGDGRSALHVRMAGRVDVERAGDADRVDADVVIEAAVL